MDNKRDTRTDEEASVRSSLLGGKAVASGSHRQAGPPWRPSQSLTASPTRPAFPAHRFVPESAPRTAALWSEAPPLWGAMSPESNLGSAPASPADDFWRLLPVAPGSRRNSTTAAGKRPAGQTTSWNDSTSSSVETVRKSPLTPFPTWREEPEREGGPSIEQPEQRHDAMEQENLAPSINASILRCRGDLNTAMHGAMLVGQCIVSLAVFSIFVAVVVCQKGKPEYVLGDSSIWNYPGPFLGLTLVLCVGVLFLHETCVLSTVTIVCLQALILATTSGTSLALWIWILTQNTGQTIKGFFVGCLTMMEGTAMLAFARAALVWWLLEERGELGGGGEPMDQDDED